MSGNTKELLRAVRRMNAIESQLLTQAVNYDQPGGCNVEAVEKAVRDCGQQLVEESKQLVNWHG